MATKHFCDRCGEEIGRNQVETMDIPSEYTTIGLVKSRKELCADCYGYLKAKCEQYERVMGEARVAFYASIMACEDGRKG